MQLDEPERSRARSRGVRSEDRIVEADSCIVSSFHRFEAASVHDAHLRRRRLVPDIGRSDPSVVRSRQQSERRIVLRQRGRVRKVRRWMRRSSSVCRRVCKRARVFFQTIVPTRNRLQLACRKRDIAIPGTTWQQPTPSVTRA
ncbi:hypothetical protein PHSY_002467 [Pseudozyma hubeiensis SY62]|uniref:Uncharacterized protein n=1 Tax=Pseudozyma hubeiensis (strain SY62) TaxID=1305764 RepID=R9P171_PSEHS|nr:hypothetical protein PHSY_002467 [Pseudozyma hubeiensis SY62]GAC94894.1 hypothetical protein PHSY_002467 [Pseudozyma hubeiensis SY62]